MGDFNRVKRPFDGGGVMVHGVLGPDASLMVTRLHGTIDSKKYIALLEDHILPYIENKFGKESMLQQDNARPHVSKMTTAFLESRIKTLKWPAHSPDLSPIENVWKLLKDIIYLSKSFKNIDELWTNIENGVSYINAHKREIIMKMLDDLSEKYLTVLTRNGKV